MFLLGQSCRVSRAEAVGSGRTYLPRARFSPRVNPVLLHDGLCQSEAAAEEPFYAYHAETRYEQLERRAESIRSHRRVPPAFVGGGRLPRARPGRAPVGKRPNADPERVGPSPIILRSDLRLALRDPASKEERVLPQGSSRSRSSPEDHPHQSLRSNLLYAPTRIASLCVTLPSKEAVWLREASMSKRLKLEIPSAGTITLNQRMAALDAV